MSSSRNQEQQRKVDQSQEVKSDHLPVKVREKYVNMLRSERREEEKWRSEKHTKS